VVILAAINGGHNKRTPGDIQVEQQEITFLPKDGTHAGKRLVVIYDRNGDQLSICAGQPGRPRPKEFAAREGTGHVLLTCQKSLPDSGK
jgi:hypothetical protein